MRMRPSRFGPSVCRACAGALGTRSWTKRCAAISCSAGSSDAPSIASGDVPITSWLGVTAPTVWYSGQASFFWRRCT